MNDAFYNQDHATQAAIHDNYIDEQEREYNKRKELIEKFTDGWQKYNFDPLFRSVIESLVRGADVWTMLEKLFEMNIELSAKLKKLLEQWPGPNWPKI